MKNRRIHPEPVRSGIPAALSVVAAAAFSVLAPQDAFALETVRAEAAVQALPDPDDEAFPCGPEHAVDVKLLVDTAMPTADLIAWARDAALLDLALTLTGGPLLAQTPQEREQMRLLALDRTKLYERLAEAVGKAPFSIHPLERRRVLDALGMRSEELPDPLVAVWIDGVLTAVPGSARPLYGLARVRDELDEAARGRLDAWLSERGALEALIGVR